MQLQLDALTVHLKGDDPRLDDQWRQITAGWSRPVSDGETPDIVLELTLEASLPPLPARPPDFVDEGAALPDNVGALSVYERGDGRVTLAYRDGAVVTVPLQDGPPPLTAVGVAAPPILNYGRFEDVTFTTLAPLLRRRGYYLLHAFAAERDGRAILLVGRSGSGKTTTGLNLLLNGWSFLANDVVLLQQREGCVFALPTPGAVSLTAETTTLLPALAAYRGAMSANPLTAKLNFALPQLANFSWGVGAPVEGIYFPQVSEGPGTKATGYGRSVALARLSEESVDRWDRPALVGHLAFLAQLCGQADCYALALGRDFERQSSLLARGAAG